MRHLTEVLPTVPGELAARTRARAANRHAGRERAQTRAAIDTIKRRFDVPLCDDSPVFLLASGWRSGSTLLQRLVVGSGQVFVWGEPYARSDQVRRMSATLLPFSDSWPRAQDIVSDEVPGLRLAGHWIANLSPRPETLVDAHRAYFRTLLQAPGKELQWGMKEVRLDATQARYLRLLFPAARFVFLVRNPYEQWRSYRRWGSWYDRWPQQVRSPEEFGAIWARIASSFVTDATAVGAHLIRYEKLVGDPAALGSLARHLGVPILSSVLDHRVAGVGSPSGVVETPEREVRRLSRYVEPLARSLGYFSRS